MKLVKSTTSLSWSSKSGTLSHAASLAMSPFGGFSAGNRLLVTPISFT